jgi:toxin CptA
MHYAPSVTYPVGRSRFALALAAGLWLAGAAALAGWLAGSAGWSWRHGAGLAALLGAGAFALAGWLRAPVGELSGSGDSWTWGEDLPGRVEAVLDLQGRMLLRWHAAAGGAALWLWVERKHAPRRWDALRRAVYSRATHAAPDAVAGAAEP